MEIITKTKADPFAVILLAVPATYTVCYVITYAIARGVFEPSSFPLYQLAFWLSPIGFIIMIVSIVYIVRNDIRREIKISLLALHGLAITPCFITALIALLWIFSGGMQLH